MNQEFMQALEELEKDRGIDKDRTSITNSLQKELWFCSKRKS